MSLNLNVGDRTERSSAIYIVRGFKNCDFEKRRHVVSWKSEKRLVEQGGRRKTWRIAHHGAAMCTGEYVHEFKVRHHDYSREGDST